jgi:hypothetical protein
MAVDLDVLEQIRERLRVSTRVEDERIEVATRDDDPMDTEPASAADRLALSEWEEGGGDPAVREEIEEG